MNSIKVKYKASFQDDWLWNSDFKSWVKKVDWGKCSAKSPKCCKFFSISGQDMNSYSHMLNTLNIKSDFQKSRPTLLSWSNNQLNSSHNH